MSRPSLMESLAQNIGGPATPRPVLSLGADTHAVLQAGRVVAGHVIESHANGSVLVAIGNMRVPARAQVAMQAGQRFMATVEANGETLFLRVMTGDKAPANSALLAALRALLPGSSSVGAALGELFAALSSRGGEGGEQALLAQLKEHIFQPGAHGKELASLIQRAGAGLEAALFAASLKRGKLSGNEVDELRRNLKARLLMARSSMSEGPLAESLTKALRAIESEQVLNLARSSSAEAQRISVPFPMPGFEGGAWTTAYLSFTKREGGDSSSEGEEADYSCRFRVELELAKLGPVRAEVGLCDGDLKLLLGVADERTRTLLEGALPSYVNAMRAKGLKLEASVRVAPREELVRAESVDGVRLLNEYHLLDESA